MIKFEFVRYKSLGEKAFIALNRLLWKKAINLLHWFVLNQLENIS